jgi:hypothetical protein
VNFSITSKLLTYLREGGTKREGGEEVEEERGRRGGKTGRE